MEITYKEIEQMYGVKVLWAVENGSRAWGYSSDTSDHDVRFLYIRPTNDYLKLYEPSDYIEFTGTMDGEEATWSGWDLKKFMRMLHKGNAQCNELFSVDPIYNVNEFWMEEISDKVNVYTNLNLRAIAFHYWGISHQCYKERMLNVETPALKKYFSLMRPLLMLEYIFENKHILPIKNNCNINQLLQSVNIPEDVSNELNNLLKQKRNGTLTTTGRSVILDNYAENRIKYFKDNMESIQTRNLDSGSLDKLYLNILTEIN